MEQNYTQWQKSSKTAIRGRPRTGENENRRVDVEAMKRNGYKVPVPRPSVSWTSLAETDDLDRYNDSRIDDDFYEQGPISNSNSREKEHKLAQNELFMILMCLPNVTNNSIEILKRNNDFNEALRGITRLIIRHLNPRTDAMRFTFDDGVIVYGETTSTRYLNVFRYTGELSIIFSWNEVGPLSFTFTSKMAGTDTRISYVWIYYRRSAKLTYSYEINKGKPSALAYSVIIPISDEAGR